MWWKWRFHARFNRSNERLNADTIQKQTINHSISLSYGIVSKTNEWMNKKNRWNGGGFCFRQGTKMMYGWTLPPPRATIIVLWFLHRTHDMHWNEKKRKEMKKTEHMEYEWWWRIVNENRIEPNRTEPNREENRNAITFKRFCHKPKIVRGDVVEKCKAHTHTRTHAIQQHNTLLYGLVSHLLGCILFFRCISFRFFCIVFHLYRRS